MSDAKQPPSDDPVAENRAALEKLANHGKTELADAARKLLEEADSQ